MEASSRAQQLRGPRTGPSLPGSERLSDALWREGTRSSSAGSRATRASWKSGVHPERRASPRRRRSGPSGELVAHPLAVTADPGGLVGLSEIDEEPRQVGGREEPEALA